MTDLYDYCDKPLAEHAKLELISYDPVAKTFAYDGHSISAAEKKYIANGSFGTVVSITFIHRGKRLAFAVKRPIGDDEAMQQSLVDHAAVRSCSSKEKASLLPYRMLTPHVMVMPLASMALHEVNHPLSVPSVRHVLRDITATLACLMERKVYYFDIKMDNIVLDCVTRRVLLADHGSMYVKQGASASYICTWSAPDKAGCDSYTQRYATRYGPQLYTYLLTLLALALLDNNLYLNNRPFAETKGKLMGELKQLHRVFQTEYRRRNKVRSTALALLRQVIVDSSVKQLPDFRTVIW